MSFWYRESPGVLAMTDFGGLPGVSAMNPPLEQPGEALIHLDPEARLRLFIAVPPLDARQVSSPRSRDPSPRGSCFCSFSYSSACCRLSAEPLVGIQSQIGVVLAQGRVVILEASVMILIYFVLRLVLRRTWLAAIVFSVFPFVLAGGFASPSALVRGLSVADALIFATILVRFGFLPIIVCLFTIGLLRALPITTDLSAWYGGSTWIAIIAIVSLTVFACHTALAGRRLFRPGLLETD